MTSKPFIFEHRSEPVLPRAKFVHRLARSVGLAVVIAAVSLGVGTLGYCHFADLGYVDGFLNASMILTGMGPVDRMTTTGGKLFSGCYALYSGMAFLTMMAVLVAPFAHRMLHRFHAATEDEEEREEYESADDESRTKSKRKKVK